MPSRWIATPADRTLFREQSRSFVPPDAFDVHAHLYPISAAGAIAGADERDVGVAAYRRAMTAWMGDRAPRDGLFFGPPTSPVVDVGANNRFVVAQLRRHRASCGLVLARPNDDPAAVDAELVRTNARGLKVYYTFLGRAGATEAEIDEYVPRWMWELADRRGLVIMLHLVKSRALADSGNQRSLRANCRRFGSARVILAHAARGFNGGHTIEGIGALARLDNVFFDTSAICESDPLLAILRQFGPGRLMFGSDFPVCMLRGRAVGIGDGFGWFMERSCEWSTTSTRPPTLIGIESLFAVKRAATLAGLRDRDVEAIFGGNARALLSPLPFGARAGGVESNDIAPKTGARPEGWMRAL